MLVCPLPLYPHAPTVPSRRKASDVRSYEAMATMFVSYAGGPGIMARTVSPRHDATFSFQRHALVVACCDGNHVGHGRGVGRITRVVSPRNDGSIGFQRHTV